MCCNARWFYTGLSIIVVIVAVILRCKTSSDILLEQPLPQLQPRTFGLALGPSVKVMVLLSGWPDTHTVWEKQIDAMKEKYHIVSIPSPDHDQPNLRKRWGYTLEEVPRMNLACIDLHLTPDRKIDVLLTHDWGALYGYYVLQLLAESGRENVERLVAIDVGASENDDASLPAHIPGITHATPYSVPYQIFLGTLFAIGSGVSESAAHWITVNGWSLMPLLTPMNSAFDWDKEAVRPQGEVKWWSESQSANP